MGQKLLRNICGDTPEMPRVQSITFPRHQKKERKEKQTITKQTPLRNHQRTKMCNRETFLEVLMYIIFNITIMADDNNQSTDSTSGSVVSECRLGK